MDAKFKHVSQYPVELLGKWQHN